MYVRLRFLKISSYVLLLLFLGCGVALAIGIFWGSRLAAPALAQLTPPPDLPVKDVKIKSQSGSMLAGWLLEANNEQGSVLLLHGVRGNRGDMIGLMRFFHAFHYTVLAVDLQAHGESKGDQITFGYLESKDAAAAVAYLWKRNPDGPVFVFGRSLGGASAIMAPYEKAPTAVVAEAAFQDIETAIANRMEMRFGRWGRALTPLLSWQFEPRLGISAEGISPLNSINELDAPILLIYGLEDEHCRPQEGEALKRAAHGPVKYVAVAGADHNTINRISPESYLNGILEFLENSKASSASPPAN